MSIARLYAAYAAACLIGTVLSGVWMRAGFVAPGVLGGVRFQYAIHAHSHLALFGWATMGLFAIVAARADLARRVPWLRLHAHAVGVASVTAFVTFLRGGYDAASIAVSGVHVALWAMFAVVAWRPLGQLGDVSRHFLRAALVFLCVAGLGSGAPGIVMARGLGEGWIAEIAVHAMLTPFLAGWLILAVMGAVYPMLPRARWWRAALVMTMVGVVPSALLHPVAAPPAEWLTLVGRVGTGAVGIGTLLFALDLLAWRGAPLLRLAGAAAMFKGIGEVAVALGVGLELVAVRSLTIAYIHLVLLGLVTPVLLALAVRSRPAPRWFTTYTAGLSTMLGALVLLGLPGVLAGLGVVGAAIAGSLYAVALLGAVAIAIGAAGLVAAGLPLAAPLPAPHEARRSAVPTQALDAWPRSAGRVEPDQSTATSTIIATKSSAR